MYTPSSSSQPRPILKRSQCAPPAHHRSLSADKLVHFPPSPTLTRTFSAHSSTAYDRSPIVVTPNSCALPERGCPGRTYTLEEERSSSPILMKKKVSNNGIHLHPRAVPPQQDPYVRPSHLQYHQNNADDDFQRSPRSTSSSLPPLIPDLSSSESDESDGFISPPPEAYHPSLVPAPSIPKPRSRGASIMSSVASMSEQGTPSTPTPLSFLPHPPSPDDAHKSRRRRQRDRSRERERERDSKYDVRAHEDRKSRASYKPLGLYQGFSACSIDDSAGCLGGF